MKKLSKILLLILITQFSFGQRLTLNDIENICNKSNWESVNQFLMNKNWEYYESEKGNSDKYSTITWSFNKSYGDKASAWFYLYTYEGFPNKLSYSVFNKPSYSTIYNSLSSKGYKLKDSQIEDNEIISTYANSKFILKITTEKREKENYSSFNESITAYKFLLIKKSSIYDPDNGKKVDYYYGNIKQAEYTKVNGKLDGVLKVYFENGNLKKTGYYKNGIANGKFLEYNEGGNKTFEYYMKNDKKDGKLIAYKDNKISFSTHYKGDIQNGERIDYYYNEDNETLNLKMIGAFLNGEKEGVWKLIYVDKEKGDRTLTKINYAKGKKNGFSQDVRGDTLIIANYNNDKLDGNFKVYLDGTKAFFGGVIETDISKLILLSEGNYTNDKKTDYWKNYSITKSLTSEGKYLNDKKTGEWKNYYSKYTIDGKPAHFSEKLYLIENYNQGKLNGLSTRFSYLNKEKYKCTELDKKYQEKDSCTRLVYEKVHQKANYRDNKLDGDFELRDSLNQLVAKGTLKNDKKNGFWVHRYSDINLNNEPYEYFMEGHYKDDKREGEWVYYYKKNEIKKTLNYSNGELDGKLTKWNKYKKPSRITTFKVGEFKELVVYDSLGLKPNRQYKILDDYPGAYECLYTKYTPKTIISQEYWIKKGEKLDLNYIDLFFIINLSVKDSETFHKDGDYKVYDLNNNPLVIGTYYKENKMGVWDYFYYSKKVKIEIDYSDSNNIREKYLTLDNQLFTGDFVLINEDENTKEIRTIKNGLRNGNTVTIDLNTQKKLRKVKYKDGAIK